MPLNVCFLEMYVNEVSKGLSDPLAKPCIIRETVSTAFVDGNNGIGSVNHSFPVSGGLFCYYNI